MASTEVVTRGVLDAPPGAVWDALMFYEQIDERPPWLLRLLLPEPLGTEGPKENEGDEALCRYRGGHLRKRVTEIHEGSYYGFEVAEQRLRIGAGIVLSGGSYALRPLPDGRTEVSVVTRYAGGIAALRGVERAVCHLFHRHLIGAIGRALPAG